MNKIFIEDNVSLQTNKNNIMELWKKLFDDDLMDISMSHEKTIISANYNKLGDINLCKYIRNNCDMMYVNINSEQMVNEILESYSKDKKISQLVTDSRNAILSQISIDYPRIRVYVNDKQCDTLSDFKTRIQNYYHISHPIMYSLYYLILMLCTQSTLYYPFVTLYKLHSQPDKNLHVLCDDDREIIRLYCDPNHVNMILTKKFKFVDVDSNKLLKKFQIMMTIDINIQNQKANIRDTEFIWLTLLPI